MAPEVEIGPVRDPLELRPPEGELVLDVGSGLCVVRELVRRVGPEAELLRPHAEREEPAKPLLLPVLEPSLVAPRLHEVLDLHELELPGAEAEVRRRDPV